MRMLEIKSTLTDTGERTAYKSHTNDQPKAEIDKGNINSYI